MVLLRNSRKNTGIVFEIRPRLFIRHPFEFFFAGNHTTQHSVV
jgi:hypothetical protein